VQTDNTNVAGKIVVITGASSGLGEATARHLAERGAAVVLGARRAERLQALVEEITQQGGRASAIVTDVASAAQVQTLVDSAVDAYGRIDVILNNAGVMPHSPLERRKITTGAGCSFARAVAFAISQPEDVDINEILFRPTRQEL